MLNLQLLRKSASRLVCRLIVDKPLSTKPFQERPHILLLRWDAKLGDAIVSSFFYREARKLNARVTVITVKELAKMHESTFGADEVIITTPNPGPMKLRKLAGQLRNVDVVVHLVGRLQPAEIFFIHLIKPAHLYSLDDSLRCVNHKMGFAANTLNIVEQYQFVLNDLGVKTIHTQYIIALPAELPPKAQSPQILFNPYASREDKGLSASRAEVALKAIADNFPAYSIGVLCSPVTQHSAQRLVGSVARNNVVGLYDGLTPEKVAGYIRQAKVVVSVDTAIVHMAVGLKAKLVAIYPLIEGQYNPWLPPSSPFTRIIYSVQQLETLRRTGKKTMNVFSMASLLNALSDFVITPLDEKKTLSLNARIISGLGVATGTLARQLPLISKEFPEVAVCYPGTINVEFDTPVNLLHPDHRTSPLAWTPSGRTKEMFDLLRIEIEFSHLPERITAWLYIAHGSPHRQTPTIHEVIAPRINTCGARQCRLHFPADAITFSEEHVVQATEAINLSLSSIQ